MTRWARGLEARWSAAWRAERRAFVVLGVLVAVGAALRIWLLLSWRPAFMGFDDSGQYLLFTQTSLFGDSLRPGGYGAFLRLVHAVSPQLSAAVAAQHVLGIAAALLLYACVRRATGSAWPGLVPAAVVLLEGTGIFVEHSILSEGLFIFLQACALYALVRSLDRDARGWRGIAGWTCAAGLCAGLGSLVRLGGLFLIGVVVIAVIVRGRALPQRILCAGVAVVACAAPLLAYAVLQHQRNGYFGLAHANSWNIYGRVAPFADCSKFTAPQGTRVLCEKKPPSERPGPAFYVFSGETPAVHHFGGPGGTVAANQKLAAFARTVILNQPLDYLKAVGSDLRRYVSPNCCFRSGFGLGADGFVHDFLLARVDRQLQPYWQTPPGYLVKASSISALTTYERHSRVQGALILVLLLLAVAGPWFAPPGARFFLVLFTLVALGSILTPPLTIYYDARLAVPSFGLLGMASGAGGWAITMALLRSGWLQRLRQRARAGPGPEGDGQGREGDGV